MPTMKLPTVSGSVHSTHENCGTSEAVCMPTMKLPTVSGFEDFLCSTHKSCGTSQAFCVPTMKFAHSLRL